MDAYEELSSSYQGMYSHHSGSRAEYIYDVDGFGVVLNDIGWDAKVNLDEAMVVRKITLMGFLD